MSVDIIIPIYNAYDELTLCLSSIYKYTDLDQNRLILINDNSPDERIRTYLDGQNRKNVIVIHNENNRGFSNNINKGMEQSQNNDVLLLNSDTVVTKNWLEKIKNCAYSDTCIGTVTPLSNNATLCSVPDFCEENTLPEGMSIDEMAEIVEECSMKKYPRITVANGFCMYIKREVINTVGNFDAETFERGYGEENDFCNRAEQMGYIHVMCDDTYIYHSGTKSFVSKEKEEYIRVHDRILRERYPEQMHLNDEHVLKNPNGYVSRNIGFYSDIWNNKKNILYVLQSDFKDNADDCIGGTQLHVKHLMQGLRADNNIFVAARNREILQITAYTKDNTYTFRFKIGEKREIPVIHDRELSRIFRQVLTGFKIDIVHVHHTATGSLDIFYEAYKLNIPVIFTMHDFFAVCPSEKLLDENGCNCVDKTQKNCTKCLATKRNISDKNNFIEQWRRKHNKIFEFVNKIIVPTDSVKDIAVKFYPEYADKIQVIEHGIDENKMLLIDKENATDSEEIVWNITNTELSGRCPVIEGEAYFKTEKYIKYKAVISATDSTGKEILIPANFELNRDAGAGTSKYFAYIPNGMLSDGDIKISLYLLKNGIYYTDKKHTEIIKNVIFAHKAKMKVAFIGGINEEKGGRIITDIVKKNVPDVEWYVMGGIGDYGLYHTNRENLIKTEYYYPEDIGQHLTNHKIDVACILSKWNETFSYTLSEAIINHIPVIVTDIGALGQRTRDLGCGEIVSADEQKASNEVVDKLNYWMNNPETYQSIKNKLESLKHKTIAEMVAEYNKLYADNYRTGEKTEISKSTLEEINKHLGGCDDTMAVSDEIIEKMNAMEARIRKIDNNATIKIMLRITERNFPFKNQLKKLIMKHK